jgi:AhpD family alkylhydroperoxidase
MLHDWPQMTKDLSGLLKEVHAGQGSSAVMKNFSAMARSAMEPKALDTKTKELIALGISVAVRCDPCVAFHARAAVEQGASREEVQETISTAIYMGAGPSVMYAAKALEAYDQFVEAKKS